MEKTARELLKATEEALAEAEAVQRLMQRHHEQS